MNKKILIPLLAAALVVCGLIATKAFAADTGIGSATIPAHGKILERIANQLKLTADQRTQIKSVISGEKDTLAPLLTSVHDARKDLRSAIRASDANEANVRAASAKVASAEADLAVERMKLYGKIAPILTDDQRAQLAGLQQRADEFVDNVIARIGSGLGD